MGFIDWDLVWNNEMAFTSKNRMDNGYFWDDIAGEKRKVNIPDDITARHLDLISASGKDTILEIGPGQGRLTLPLARTARRLIGIEPSRKMAERLMTEYRNEKIKNIDIINLKWNSLDPSMLADHPDIILASYSLFMTNISKQLKKMNDLAKEKVILFMPGESRLPWDLQQILFGFRASTGMSEHVIIFNMLHDMGIDANVDIISYSSSTVYPSMEDAVKRLSQFHNVPVNKVDAFGEYLGDALSPLENGSCELTRNRKSAAIRWWTH